MAEAKFSWFKLASFFGATILLVIAIVTIASGIGLITDGSVFKGIVCSLSGLVSGVGAIVVYENYQHKTGY